MGRRAGRAGGGQPAVIAAAAATAGAVVGFAVGWVVSRPSEDQPTIPVAVETPRARVTPHTQHPALKHGIPLAQNLRVFDQYVSSFDSRTRNPQWVLEHVNRHTVQGDADRGGSRFKEDTSIAPHLRNRLDDFKDSGYDRGHLTPAADHKNSQRAMDQSFSLSNVSPQVGKGFNRSYWARFEKFVRDLGAEWDDVWVVTGPLFLPTRNRLGRGWTLSHPMIGRPPSMVAVPTHFFKVVLAESSGRNGRHHAVGAFVMPNADVPPDTPLTSWLVPVENLEAAAGMTFFSDLLDTSRRSLLAEAEAHVMQQLGRGDAASSPLLLEGAVKPPPVTPNREVRRRDGADSHSFSHLCERTRCELVSDEWVQQFHHHNANGKRSKPVAPRPPAVIQAPPAPKPSSVVIEEVSEGP